MAEIMHVEVEPGYEPLFEVLVEALNQSQHGKGKERHATDDPFLHQPICQISRRHGIGFALGQAEKKAGESHRLPGERGVKELLGTIVYAAAAILVRREQDHAVEPPIFHSMIGISLKFTDNNAEAELNMRHGEKRG